MKALKHTSTLLIVFLFSLFLVNCEKVDLNTEINSSQLKAAQIFPNTTIDYLVEVISTLEEMVENGILSYGNANALISKAENAIKSIEKGNINAVSGQLAAFTNQVEVFVEEEILSAEDGLILVDLVINGPQPVNTFTDPRDNKVYATVQIGDQVWMAENLAYLPTVDHASDGSYTDPRYYVYSYDGTIVSEAKANSNYQNYGVLYNWPAAMVSCPAGWHLPTEAEWRQLELNLGMSPSDIYVFGFRGPGIGDKLKATQGWDMEGNGTNESGFTALPGGYRNYDGGFFTAGGAGFWWTATERDSNSSWDRALSSGYSTVRRLTMGKPVGYSVRCIQD